MIQEGRGMRLKRRQNQISKGHVGMFSPSMDNHSKNFKLEIDSGCVK